jgi:hypothetical protein
MVERKGPVKPPTIDLEAKGKSAGTAKSKPAQKSAGPRPRSTTSAGATRDRTKPVSGGLDLPTLFSGAALGAVLALVIGFALFTFLPRPDVQNNAGVEAVESKVRDIDSQLAALQARLDEPVDTTGLTALRDDLTQVQTDLTSLSETTSKSLKALADQTPDAPNLEAVNARIDALNTAIETVSTAPPSEDLAALKSEITALSTRLETIAAAPPPQPVDTTEASRLVLAFAGLDSALLAGRPFAAEIDTITASLPDLAQPEAIRANALDGLPTLAAANRAFAKSVPAILAARPAQDGRGWQETLMDKAKAILAIRPANPEDDTSPDALVARIEQALEDGDLETAATLIAQLPDLMRTAGGTALTDITDLAAARAFAIAARQAALSPSAEASQ